jgi:hypothetical protein
MQQGTGYVLLTEHNNGIGIGLIHVCDGDRLVGKDIAFRFSDCSSQLRGRLESLGDTFSTTSGCPPPPGSTRVSFNFDIFKGRDIAVNVR